MDWEFFTHHMLCGCIPATAALILYFSPLNLLGKKQNAGHIFASFVFCFYLIGVLTVTGICIKAAFSPRIVFVPFADMIRGPKDTALNILLFVPMGFFLPVLYRQYGCIGKVAFAGFLISLSIEIVQLFGFGASDINDLITNTVGACLGYCVYRLICRIIPETWIKEIQVDGVQCFYEPLVFWIGSLLIMLTVQVYSFHALFKPAGETQVWK